jgi:hypothetical protein
MATRDIMPYMSPRGGHDFIVTASTEDATTRIVTNTSFREGEPLFMTVAAGTMAVIDDGASAVTTNFYVAAVSSAGLLNLNEIADATTPCNIPISMYPLTGPNAGHFVCQYIVTNSDTQLTAAERLAIMVGDTVGLWRDNTATGVANNGENGRMSIDTNTTGMSITRKLDVLGRDADISGQAVHSYVFINNSA